MGISVTIPLSYTGSKYQYSNHRKHKVLDKLNLTDVYNFVLNADLTKIFFFVFVLLWNGGCLLVALIIFSSISPCHATCFISAYL